MSTFLAYLWRLLVVSTGFVCAAATAGLICAFIVLQLFDMPSVNYANLIETIVDWFFFALLIGGMSAMLTVVPTVALAILAEIFSWRGFIGHGVLGAVLGAFSAGMWGSAQDPDRPLMMLAGAAAGICGAWVYWLIAGRNAGRLFDRIAGERNATKS